MANIARTGETIRLEARRAVAARFMLNLAKGDKAA
jgi:hypothetical protein